MNSDYLRGAIQLCSLPPWCFCKEHLDFEESIKNFEKALKISEEENDLESYTLCLAQLAISYIFMGNVDEFIEYTRAVSSSAFLKGCVWMWQGGLRGDVRVMQTTMCSSLCASVLKAGL